MNIPSPLSKSSIGTFETCPWLWFAIYIEKRKRAIGMAAMNGISTHDAIKDVIVGNLEFPAAVSQAPNSEVRQLLNSCNTHWPLDELKERYKAGEFEIEESVFVTKTGTQVKTRRSALVTGVLDIVEPKDEGLTVLVDDWKTGRWEKDDERERHIYAGIIAPAMFPKATKAVFTLRFLRSGNILRSIYRFSDTRKTILVTDPFGETTVHNSEANPFLEQIREIATQIKEAKPEPKHGPHCKKQFGAPCQFYSDGTCPYWAKQMKKESS